MRRSRRSLALVACAALVALLAACTSLPTSGEPEAGLALDEADFDPDISQIAARPLEGASPEQIVEGFLDAALTPDNGWAIAREFLSAELATTWRPSAGVTIDASALDREITADIEGAEKSASSAGVRVVLDQIARVDENGAYTELPGDESLASFEVERNDDGEWRITSAANGVILDAVAFPQVFRQYALQYFDPGWSHLVPDSRWYPRRQTVATTLTQALLNGSPSEWLAGGVRSAFPSDVTLARDSVPVSADKVATVELTPAAAALDDMQTARMRTQLEATLRPAGVTEVELSVNGRNLGAGTAPVDTGRADSSPVVLTETAFGTYVGDEIMPVEGISPVLLELGASVRSVNISADDTRAAVQLDSGTVFTVSGGNIDELDNRPGLVEPAMDPYGFTWTVPQSAPQMLTAWKPDVTSIEVQSAFHDASAITDLSIAADGVRLAASITLGGQRWLALAAIIRDQDQVPVEIGPVHLVTQLDGAAHAVSWIGTDELGILVAVDDTSIMRTQSVGGPGADEAAPADAVTLSGGQNASSVRVLDSDGVLFAQRGTTWQMALSGVLVLGSHVGQ